MEYRTFTYHFKHLNTEGKELFVKPAPHEYVSEWVFSEEKEQPFMKFN